MKVLRLEGFSSGCSPISFSLVLPSLSARLHRHGTKRPKVSSPSGRPRREVLEFGRVEGVEGHRVLGPRGSRVSGARGWVVASVRGPPEQLPGVEGFEPRKFQEIPKP